MPPNLLLNSGFASSTSVVVTSSYPYYSNGPIDFSQLNFVRTEQTDYFYDTDASGTQHLVSTVTQTYDPILAMLMLGGVVILFFAVLGYFISKIRKMGK